MTHNNLTKELISRTNQISFYKYIGVLPNPDSLFVRHGKTYQTYRELRNDPHLWACIQSRKSGTLAREWQLLQGSAGREVFEFVRLCFGNIDMQQLIRQMLEAVFMGFQAFEIVWQPQYWNGSTIYSVKDISSRPQEYFCFDTKGKLQLKSVTSQESRALPGHKVLLLQHEADYENPYGQPLLGKCYWACTFKSTALRFWVNFIEKFGMPTIIASSEHLFSETEQQDIMEKLIQMQDSNAVVAGGDLNIQLHETNKAGNVELYQQMINLCNAEISKVVLSSTLTTEIVVGSFAAAKTHQEVRQDIVEADLELVEKGMNALIDMICGLNFGHCERPVFAFE